MASEPMQRLRAAWLTKERAETWELRRGILDRLAEARHERDGLRRQLESTRALLDSDRAQLTRERDEARAEVERLRAALEKVAEAVGVPKGDRALDSIRKGIERLRAAQQLPDVGPVTRGLRGHLWIDGYEFSGPDQLDGHEQHALRELAMVHAGRAFLDAEAADTSSDDEVDPEVDPEVERLARVMHEADSASLGSWVDVDREAYRDMARAAITHHSSKEA